MLTDDQLAAWQALCDAATPGPWVREHPTEPMLTDWACVYTTNPRFLLRVHLPLNLDAFRGSHEWGTPEYHRGPEQPAADADFIAAARKAMPALIAEVRRLRAALAAETERCAGVAAKFANAKEVRYACEALRGLGVPDHMVTSDGYEPAHPMIRQVGASIEKRIRDGAPTLTGGQGTGQ